MPDRERVFSFGAGPACWPDEVLERISQGMLPRFSGGLSVLEWSHRSPEYEALQEEVKSLLRSLLEVPENFQILLLPGGATMQFAMAPINLRPDPRRPVDFVLTGSWSKKALETARRSGEVRVAADGAAYGAAHGPGGVFSAVPPVDDWDMADDAAYLHLTTNNTIVGSRVREWPKGRQVPIVADASSDIMLAPLAWEDLGMVYAGGQKNLGPAGMAVVIIRSDLLDSSADSLAPIFSYKAHAEARSLLNTPPTALVFMMREMLAWVRDEGGREEMLRRALQRAESVYGALEEHEEIYEIPVRRSDRSLTNIVFRLKDASSDADFLRGAAERRMIGLGGHRSVGGFRASMYNGVSLEAVGRLVEYIHAFARRG